MSKLAFVFIMLLLIASCTNKQEKLIIGKWSAEITKDEKIENDYHADRTMIERTYLNGTLVFENIGTYKLNASNNYLISKDDKGSKFDTMQIVKLTNKELWLKKPDLSFIITMSKR